MNVLNEVMEFLKEYREYSKTPGISIKLLASPDKIEAIVNALKTQGHEFSDGAILFGIRVYRDESIEGLRIIPVDEPSEVSIEMKRLFAKWVRKTTAPISISDEIINDYWKDFIRSEASRLQFQSNIK